VSTSIGAELLGRSYREREAVTIEILSESVGNLVVQLSTVAHVVTKTNIDVLGEACVVLKSHFESHPALNNPPARFGGLKTSDDPFEQHAAAETVQRDSGLVRPVEQPLFERNAKRIGGLVGHDGSTFAIARSI
jgi:hypothetical protein